MKKYIVSFFVVATFITYAVYQRVVGTSPSVADNNNSNSQDTSNNVLITTPTPDRIPKPAPVPAPKPAGVYKDGSYTGSVADAYYGNVQVQAVIQSGKLSDVQILQYPSDRSTSIRINTQAMPILRSEAIKAQSANVNIVSGATDSSGAFRVSLASALSQAKN